MSEPVFCTIVARNYLAHARVFASSLREQHPAARVFVLLLDPEPEAIPVAGGQEAFELLTVDDLGIQGLPALAFRYDVLELGTALKPTLLLYLRERIGCEKAFYFDPDILVLAELDQLISLLDDRDLLLTPHITAPIDDAAIPGERELLVAGVYNLGFLGLRFTPQTAAFLAWWARRLSRGCRQAIEHGLFVDQKWMDLSPAMLERVQVLRDPGLNMAYWNLAHRRLERTGQGTYRVDGAPLRFFHFSGFDSERPELVSRYQNRFRLGDRPDLASLVAEYSQRLTAAGHREQRRTPYGWGSYRDSTPVSAEARRLFAETDPEGRRWPDPFAVDGADSFRSWAEGCGAEGALPLPRQALAAWGARHDLRLRFPRLQGEDRADFAAWVLRHPASVGLSRAARDRLAVALGSAPKAILSRAETREPLVGGRRQGDLPALAVDLLAARADLRRQFPDAAGADRRQYAIWLATHGRAELDLPASCWRPVLGSLGIKDRAWVRLWWLRRWLRDRRRESLRPARPTRESDRIEAASLASPRDAGPIGVNLVGWPDDTSGTAAICRNMRLALDEARLPWVSYDLGRWQSGAGPARAAEEQDGLPYEISLVHANADMTPEALARIPVARQEGGVRVGYWFWELAHFPAELAAGEAGLSEIWTPTCFVADAVRGLATVPVRTVAPCVPVPAGRAPFERTRFGIDPKAFLFLFAFDGRSVPERKNPLGLLEAFGAACRSASRPLALLLKTQHLDRDSAMAREIRRRAARLPVHFVDDHFDEAQMDALQGLADAYVSLHRSEGFGIPLVEAMLLGKPVLATGYGGVVDFLDEETGFVVPHRLIRVGPGREPYPAAGVWAEPDLARAADLMCEVAAGGDAVQRRARAGRERALALFAPAAAGRRIGAEIARLAAGMPTQRSSS